jgi:hypothetical protein
LIVSEAKGGDRAEMMRRLRVGNLRKLLRDRYGHTLPDDDAGRADLRELLLPISLAPHSAIKMPKVIEVWAPWMPAAEGADLIDEINQMPPRSRKPTARLLGKRLNVTNAQRERLKLWTIAACDMSPAQALAWRKAKAKARMRQIRQSRGAKPQATSINRTEPWIAAGISRRTWYRRRGTVSCEVKLSTAENEVVPPKQAHPPKKRASADRATASNGKAATKAEKSKTKRGCTSADVTDREFGERSCANAVIRRRHQLLN